MCGIDETFVEEILRRRISDSYCDSTKNFRRIRVLASEKLMKGISLTRKEDHVGDCFQYTHTLG